MLAGSVEAYGATSPWNEFGSIVPLTQDDIDAVEDVPEAGRKAEAVCYDLQGRKIAEPQRGINIIRMSDGTTRKVMVK